MRSLDRTGLQPVAFVRSAIPSRYRHAHIAVHRLVSFLRHMLRDCGMLAASNFSSSDTLVRVCCSSRYAARVSVDIEEDHRPSSRSVGGPSRGVYRASHPLIDCGGMSAHRLPSPSQAVDAWRGAPALALIRALAAIGAICSRAEHHMFPQYSLRFR